MVISLWTPAAVVRTVLSSDWRMGRCVMPTHVADDGCVQSLPQPVLKRVQTEDGISFCEHVSFAAVTGAMPVPLGRLDEHDSRRRVRSCRVARQLTGGPARDLGKRSYVERHRARSIQP